MTGKKQPTNIPETPNSYLEPGWWLTS